MLEFLQALWAAREAAFVGQELLLGNPLAWIIPSIIGGLNLKASHDANKAGEKASANALALSQEQWDTLLAMLVADRELNDKYLGRADQPLDARFGQTLEGLTPWNPIIALLSARPTGQPQQGQSSAILQNEANRNYTNSALAAQAAMSSFMGIADQFGSNYVKPSGTTNQFGEPISPMGPSPTANTGASNYHQYLNPSGASDPYNPISYPFGLPVNF